MNTDNTRGVRPVKAAAADQASAPARRLAAVILEVLSGLRGPAEAAQAAGLSLPRYYAAEARALRGLLRGCEPAPRGRQPSAEGELQTLKLENQRLQKQCSRQQALLRLQQRTLGISQAPGKASDTKKGKKRRRVRTRTLRLIGRLTQEAACGAAVPGPSDG
jgi:hypothetical protein